MTPRAVRVGLVVPNAIVARDFFVGGLASALAASGAQVIVLTPDPATMQTLITPGTVAEWIGLSSVPASAAAGLLSRGRRRSPWVVRPLFFAVEERLARRTTAGDTLRALALDAVVVPTPRYAELDIAVAHAARGCGIPVICVLSSWDNLDKGPLTAPADVMCVWSPALRDRAVQAHRFASHAVHIVGSLQLAPYAGVGHLDDREQFCASLSLDPSRPIVTVATTGLLGLDIDERYLVESVLNARSDAQVIFRVHPDELHRYATLSFGAGNARVRLHHAARLVGTNAMRHRWFMDQSSYRSTAVLLQHTDLLVSIGTTLHLEGALFGTPSALVDFIPAPTEAAREFLRWSRRESHLREVVADGYLPDHDSELALQRTVRTVRVGDRMEDGARSRLLRRFVGPTDALASPRVAAIVNQCAREAAVA